MPEAKKKAPQAEPPFRLPEGLTLGVGTHRTTGRTFIATPETTLYLDAEEVPHLAAMLADQCQDDDLRSFVADSWGPTW